MARYKLTVEYEGTRYKGWQIQKNDRTIQGEILGVCQDIFQTDDLEIYGSGRTDSGVHAINQVAHLDVQTDIPSDIIRLKMNDLLPADINIKEVKVAARDFHARHDAVMRSYVYLISKRRTALGKRFVWWVKDRINVQEMRKSAKLLTGMHDFRSFSEESLKDKKGSTSTKVQLEAINIYEEGDLIVLHFIGSHFLWKMVRRITGVLVNVGTGKLNPDLLDEWLHQPSKEPAKYTAPASGLFLESVYYKGETVATKPSIPIKLF